MHSAKALTSENRESGIRIPQRQINFDMDVHCTIDKRKKRNCKLWAGGFCWSIGLGPMEWKVTKKQLEALENNLFKMERKIKHP